MAAPRRDSALEVRGTAPTVLFVCPHGAAKSVMAAAYFQRLADRQGLALRATAAGTDPDAEVSPAVAANLLAEGIDVRGHRPHRVTPEELASAWHVVSLGCDPRDLAAGPATLERWDDVPPPSTDFAGARDLIAPRLGRLLEALARRG